MSEPTHYNYQVSWSNEDGVFFGRCAEFPDIFFIDSNPDKALKGIIESVGLAIEIMTEMNSPLPEPHIKG